MDKMEKIDWRDELGEMVEGFRTEPLSRLFEICFLAGLGGLIFAIPLVATVQIFN